MINLMAWLRRFLKGAALLAALLLAVTPAAVARADDPAGTAKLRVEITDGGFNGNPGDFTLEVDQGHLVELTFVWAHKAYAEQEHILVLEGYRLEWDQIDSQHREATVKFLADKPGTFTFKCDLDCPLHDSLQKGHLKVRRSGGAGDVAAALTPTRLAVTPSTWATAGNLVSLMAVLQDAQGAPVPKAGLRFALDADFAGTVGLMEVGTARTDANGVAFLDFQPTLSARQQKITVRFEGMGIYGESQAAIELLVASPPPPAYTQAPLGLDNIRRWAPVAVTAVVLTVWATYGFALFQVFGIARAGARR